MSKLRHLFDILIFFFVLLLLSSCSEDRGWDWSWQRVQSRGEIDFNKKDYSIIASSEKFLGFTDLILYRDKWYVTFRASDEHGEGTYSKIIVVKSNDFKNWELCFEFEAAGLDLRDPKFSYNDITGIMYLHVHAASQSNEMQPYAAERHNLYTYFDDASNSFREEFDTLAQHPNYPKDWLWRPVWHKGELYVGGYSKAGVKFYKYKNGFEDPVIFCRSSGTESTLVFNESSLYILIRRGRESLFGIIPDVDSIMKDLEEDISLKIDWEYLSDIPDFGGPNMIIYKDIAYIAGRLSKDKERTTTLFEKNVNDKGIFLKQTLYSFGDNSYPGMCLVDNKLYMVYYTRDDSLKNYLIKTTIINIEE